MTTLPHIDLMEPRHIGSDPLPRCPLDDAIKAVAILLAHRAGLKRTEWTTGGRYSHTTHSEPVTDDRVDWAQGVITTLLETYP